MKLVFKGSPPESLQDFIADNPDATWEQMCDIDNSAAHDCRNKAIADQGGCCAYCERRISSGDPLHRRLEHYHPKSDKSGTHNWNLDWNNMLAVCDGGSRRPQEDGKNLPLPANLSCDEHKNHMVNLKKLPVDCEGWLLNPLDAPAFPNVFTLDRSTGFLKADENNCAVVEILENTYETTAELISRTIEILNLNCDRLAEKRRRLVWDINHNIKTLRDKGYSQSDVPGKLVLRYFREKWPAFFTTLRCCLGAAAEGYLKAIDYTG